MSIECTAENNICTHKWTKGCAYHGWICENLRICTEKKQIQNGEKPI